MTYLLDTHTFLWTLFSTENLSKKSLKLISDIDNEIYVSIITFWEISLKYTIKKLELKNVLPDDLPGLAKEAGFSILPLNEYDVSTFYRLPKKIHKDPFDRLIIWQAIRNNISVITKDIRYKEYSGSGLNVIW